MSRIFFDTNLYIYLFEDHPVYRPIVQSLLQRMAERGDQLFTSWVTMAEVQIKPWELGRHTLCEQYKASIQSTSTILAFDEKASDAYRNIRATTPIKGPDALQLACASSAGIELFITNDERLQGRTVAGIHFIVSLQRVPV